MIISASGDEFFMPDDTHYFFDQLPEPKYFRLLANAEHRLGSFTVTNTVTNTNQNCDHSKIVRF